MPAQPASSFYPVTGALSQLNDPRVPAPQTLSGRLPSQMAANFNNQKLGGLLTGTSSVVGGSGALGRITTQAPSQGAPVAAPGGSISQSIQTANQNLMQLAQLKAKARQAALQRAAGASSAPQGGGGSAVPSSAPAPSGPVSFEGYTGGATFARLIPILKQRGLPVTDTYRDPEYNRRVGGVSTSFHMDKGNPAVDIGGSTAQLDAMYAVLKSMGGWRQLLWRVPGHYDHIHVA